jgi:CheY-like chemotaxis protein
MSTVLVVDDESQIRDLLVRWISSDGYEVREAETSQAALDQMQITASDIVMCDVQMPGENGVWLTAQLRSRFPETAIVLATSDRTVPSQISLQPGVVSLQAVHTRSSPRSRAPRCRMARDGGRRARTHQGRVSSSQRVGRRFRRLTRRATSDVTRNCAKATSSTVL